jgi:hypothetical protein
VINGVSIIIHAQEADKSIRRGCSVDMVVMGLASTERLNPHFPNDKKAPRTVFAKQFYLRRQLLSRENGKRD